MIPKIIHYCWFGGNPLPSDVKKCIASWKNICPDYEIKRWDESNFDVSMHPFVKAAYEAKAWAFVSDYARLKVVYDHGGIYLDTDVELVQKLDSLLSNQCYMGIQYNQHLCNTGIGFGAEQFSPVLQKMMQEYDAITFEMDKKLNFACPWLNDRVLKSMGYETSDEVVSLENLTVYPPRYFDPYPSGVNENLFCKETISIHHYSASWSSDMQKIKRKIVRWIGEDKVVVLKRALKGLRR